MIKLYRVNDLSQTEINCNITLVKNNGVIDLTDICSSGCERKFGIAKNLLHAIDVLMIDSCSDFMVYEHLDYVELLKRYNVRVVVIPWNDSISPTGSTKRAKRLADRLKLAGVKAYYHTSLETAVNRVNQIKKKMERENARLEKAI